jgi:hypothetical protein
MKPQCGVLSERNVARYLQRKATSTELWTSQQNMFNNEIIQELSAHT